ncbi:hypothetical protein [Actinoplanes solisilvae]|uniref:hypothetical protein n=1 Tax=Actinoplanes solisilvae TaxID=2486853 RepID=UPI000FD8BE35|nr:hypothetical protein [Actinoplanes solisilvae]
MTRPQRTGGRRALTVQVFLLAVCFVGSIGLLTVAAVRAGDPGALLHPGLERLGDPKESIPPIGPDALWNPLVWIFGWGRVAAMLVYLVAFVALILGLAAIAGARQEGDRRARRAAIAVTAIWLLVVVTALTPYGGSLHSWLLD